MPKLTWDDLTGGELRRFLEDIEFIEPNVDLSKEGMIGRMRAAEEADAQRQWLINAHR